MTASLPSGPDFGGFADVDATGTSRDYAAYLDGVHRVDVVAEWKRRSFLTLEPRPGAVLLDGGCGTGTDALALAEMVAPGGRVIGVDAGHSMIAEARARAGARGDVEFHVGDLRALDLPDGSVDGCRVDRTLQHLDHPDAAVSELVRVTRPGGRVVLSEPEWGTLVVDPGDPEVTCEVSRAAVRRVRSGAVGRALRGLLMDAGLTEVGVFGRPLLITDLAQARFLLDLDGAADDAVAAGRLTRPDVEAWRQGLVAAAARGRFLASMVSFMAWGRRP